MKKKNLLYGVLFNLFYIFFFPRGIKVAVIIEILRSIIKVFDDVINRGRKSEGFLRPSYLSFLHIFLDIY